MEGEQESWEEPRVVARAVEDLEVATEAKLGVANRVERVEKASTVVERRAGELAVRVAIGAMEAVLVAARSAMDTKEVTAAIMAEGMAAAVMALLSPEKRHWHRKPRTREAPGFD